MGRAKPQVPVILTLSLAKGKNPHAGCTRDDRRDSSRSALRMTRVRFVKRVISMRWVVLSTNY